MAARGADRPELVKDLQRQVTLLEDDLRVRSEEVLEFAKPLHAEYDAAREANRTAATYETWRDERVTQVAAAWVLGTVFVRFCEDNGLIDSPFLAGPGERLADAEERHEAYFRAHPERNDRDWIIESFNHLSAAHPTTAGLFDRRHNPLWEITPSFEAANALLQFWRRRNDHGEIRYDFANLDTRFLGDLYQDLSEAARKKFALLQTPKFVEEFILDLTLEPAIERFGLRGLRAIDPACGSGHFLLGIFRRLLEKWREVEPNTDNWTLIRRCLNSVHGCDKNPFAASIARFRLLVAALHEAGERRLGSAPGFPINVAVGDSLIHGRGAPGIQGELHTFDDAHTYATEDVNEFVRSCDLLGASSYHIVVANPPYITVKDKRENEIYRARYSACSHAYALAVPFAQRLFQLAKRTAGSDRDAGYIGQITANSFMKREYGKRLIENFFPTVHLTHIIDTSGAYIPGHGTPTVVLVGRNHISRRSDPIRVVLGIRGEPGRPEDPAKGLVWSAIVEQINKPNVESDWVTVADSDRESWRSFPWSLNGGGATDIQAQLRRASERLGDRTDHGYRAITGLDDVFLIPRHLISRFGQSSRPYVTGEGIRDWGSDVEAVLYPYEADDNGSLYRFLWPFRQDLLERKRFSVPFRELPSVSWWDYREYYPKRFSTYFVISFSFVATHNHFVILRDKSVANRAAPVIQLRAEASEDDHLALLGVLNSSVACFWLKQVSHDKGGQGINEGFKSQDWERFYEFTGTKLREFPLPRELPLQCGRTLDSLAQMLAQREPRAVCADAVPTRARLDQARAEHKLIQGRMIALQEELDWWVYGSYGLLDGPEVSRLVAPGVDIVPEVKLGERAFEIVLARKVAAGEVETAWFARHGSTPITEVSEHWPEWYRRIVQARIDIIEKRRDIGLIERPEYKRRWASQPWMKKEAEALRNWLLDRCERRGLWFWLREGFEQPRALTVNQLADQFRDDADVQSVAQLYASDHLGMRDLTLAQVLEQIIADEHVPYLAALRYKDSGVRKRAQWEDVWEQQRVEDRIAQSLGIPVPPKYGSADFLKSSYWAQRGKLDVPKERFISYPEASPDADPTLLLGWAGWDHKDQAQALVNLINDRATDAGWGAERVTPLLAGLAEVMPWVRQWHGEYDEAWGGVPADEFHAFLEEQRAKYHLTEQDLAGWRPEPTRRGRRGVKGKTS